MVFLKSTLNNLYFKVYVNMYVIIFEDNKSKIETQSLGGELGREGM